MNFSTFAKLQWLFDRLDISPSFAPEGALHCTKLYGFILDRPKRKDRFTSIRSKGYFYKKKIGKIIPIVMQEKDGEKELFKARVMGVKKIERGEISDNLARGDADMSKEDLIKMLNFWYKDKDIYKIDMVRVK